MKCKTILHITRIVTIGGTEKMIRQICEATRDQFERIILCAGDGEGMPSFSSCVDQCYVVDDMENKSPIVILRTLFKIKKIIDKENVDVIHVHHRMAALYVRFLNIFYHKPIIYNGHTIHSDKKMLTRFILNKYNIIADGNEVKKNLEEFYKIKGNKITLIYNTVGEFDGKISINPLLRRFKNEGYFLIGNVGRLCKEKGQEYFIKAAEIVLKKRKFVKFIIVGDGKDRKYLEEMVKDRNLINDVVFIGFQSDIKNIIMQFDVLVLSSILEGLPLTPIEAFSVGKAIVATNIDGTNELVQNGINGFLYEPENVERLAELLCNIIDNTEEWRKLSQNAYEIYQKKYSYQVFCDKYRKYYQLICDKCERIQ